MSDNADIIKAWGLEDIDNDTSIEPEADQLEETEETAVEDQEVEVDETEEAEEEDDSLAIPELGIDDPEALALWNQRWKGVIKREAKLKSQEADLELYNSRKSDIDGLLQLNDLLENPDTYEFAFRTIAKHVKELHGKDFLAQEPVSSAEPDEELDDYEAQIVAKAERKALEKLKKEFGLDDPETLAAFKELKQNHAQTTQERQLTAFLDRNYSGLANRILADTGFKPTREQALQALKARPTLKPVEAIKLHFLSEITNLKVKAPAKAPTMLKTTVKAAPKEDDSTEAYLRKHGLL